MRSYSSSQRRSSGSAVGSNGASSRLLEGRNPSRYRTSSRQALSSGEMNCATPEVEVWVRAPPSCCWVTSSPVTCFTTSGPVMNMYDVSSTMKMKSVMTGLYTAPPAHGPMMTLICGVTPDALTLR